MGSVAGWPQPREWRESETPRPAPGSVAKSLKTIAAQKGCCRRPRKSLDLQRRFSGSPLVRRLQIMDHHTELVGKIAHEVYQSLGSGFSEDVYDRAMQVGLRLAGIEYESQKVVELKYRDHYVGEGYPGLV